MNQNDKDRVPDALRRVLQQGDAAGEGGLAPGDRDRIRRRILAASPSRRWLPAFRPLRYALAGLTAVLAGWLVLQNRPPESGPLTPQLPADAAPLVAQDTPDEALPQPVIEEPAPPVQRAVQPVEEPAVAQEPVTPAVLPPSEPRRPRQMQFTTGTTRVIWTLDPDFDLGPSSTAEQGETS